MRIVRVFQLLSHPAGRLQLPDGLPDEQLIDLAGQDRSENSVVNRGSEQRFLSYLTDEGAFLMAIHVSRILTALVKSVPVSGNVTLPELHLVV